LPHGGEPCPPFRCSPRITPAAPRASSGDGDRNRPVRLRPPEPWRWRDPYAGWCGGRRLITSGYPISPGFSGFSFVENLDVARLHEKNYVRILSYEIRDMLTFDQRDLPLLHLPADEAGLDTEVPSFLRLAG